MAKEIKIHIGSYFDAKGITESSKAMAGLANEVKRQNEEIAKATLRSSDSYNRIAQQADKAARAIGGGYKTQEEMLRELISKQVEHERAVGRSAKAERTFADVLRESANAVDAKTSAEAQAREVAKALEAAERRLADAQKRLAEARRESTDSNGKLTGSHDRLRAAVDAQARRVEVLREAMRRLGATSKDVSEANGKAADSSSSSWTEFYFKFRSIATGIRIAWNAVTTAIKASFKFETMTRQFKFLTGDIDTARAHMQMLKELGMTPPFNLEEFAAASRSLMVMTDGALGMKESLVMVGDAAAATGVDLQTMGHMVGRLYALVRDGQPISRAALQLRNFGVLSPEVIAELDRMQKAGSTNAEMWAKVETALKRFNGAMKETEGTGDGLVSQLQSQWDEAVRQFGDGMMGAAKDGVGGLIEYLKKLNADGSLKEWGESAGTVLKGVAFLVDKVAKGINAANNFVTHTPSKNSLPGPLGFPIDMPEFKRRGDVFILSTGNSAPRRTHGSRNRSYWQPGMASTADKKEDTTNWQKVSAEQKKRDADLAAAQVKIDEQRAAKREEFQHKENEALEALHKSYLSAIEQMDEESATKARERMERQTAELARLTMNMKGQEKTDFERAYWLERYREESIDAKTAENSTNRYYADLFNLEKSRIGELSGIEDEAERKRIGAAYDYQRKYIGTRLADEDRILEERRRAEEELAAERKRLDEEEAKRRLDAARAEIEMQKSALVDRGNSLRAVSSAAQTEFERAFSWYRDPKAAATAIGEEQAYRDDLDRLHRDANRYGGKWRVDELSALMAAGDTQGVADTLAGWRKSSRFTPEVEAMVRASAAEQTRTTAEDELRRISANTENLDKKLDELLMMKGD